ncbi:MAG: hypothetical protein IID42_12490 [Planctomycetes bacterium]|nr:hypothetical protein [Planctomycetota bacterium]
MTPTAIRLAASIGSIPFVVGVFMITAIAFEDLLSISNAYVQTYGCAAIAAVAVWIQIWRRVVVWTQRTIVRTAALGLVSIGVPIALLAVFYDPSSPVLEVVLFMLPVMGWGVFMAMTIRGWPTVRTETAYGDAAPHCQSCGYLLKGLRSTRCPECGDEPTLDELFAASMGEGL